MLIISKILYCQFYVYFIFGFANKFQKLDPQPRLQSSSFFHFLSLFYISDCYINSLIMPKYLVITRLLVFLDIKVKMCKNFISSLRLSVHFSFKVYRFYKEYILTMLMILR